MTANNIIDVANMPLITEEKNIFKGCVIIIKKTYLLTNFCLVYLQKILFA